MVWISIARFSSFVTDGLRLINCCIGLSPCFSILFCICCLFSIFSSTSMCWISSILSLSVHVLGLTFWFCWHLLGKLHSILNTCDKCSITCHLSSWNTFRSTCTLKHSSIVSYWRWYHLMLKLRWFFTWSRLKSGSFVGERSLSSLKSWCQVNITWNNTSIE